MLLLLPLLWAGSLAQKVEHKLKIQSPVQVQEGLCVYIPCSFTLPRVILSTDKLSGAWYREGSHVFKDGSVATSHPGQNLERDARNHFLFLGNISEHNCSLVIRNARRQDHGKYFFSLTYGENKFIYSQDLLIVIVTNNTIEPKVVFLLSMDSSNSSKLSCSVPQSCGWETPPFFTWLSPVSATMGPRTSHSSILFLTPTIQDNSSNVTCQVYYSVPGVIREKIIQINVICNPETPELCAVKLKPGVALGWVEGLIGGALTTILFGVCVYLPYYKMKKQRQRRAAIRPAKEAATHTLVVPDKAGSFPDQKDSKKTASMVEEQQEQFQPSLVTSKPNLEEETPSLITFKPFNLEEETPSLITFKPFNLEEETPSLITSTSNPEEKAPSLITLTQNPEEKAPSLITLTQNPEEKAPSLITLTQNPEEKTPSLITLTQNPEEKAPSLITLTQNPEEKTPSLITLTQNPEEKTPSLITLTQNPEEETPVTLEKVNEY